MLIVSEYLNYIENIFVFIIKITFVLNIKVFISAIQIFLSNNLIQNINIT